MLRICDTNHIILSPFSHVEKNGVMTLFSWNIVRIKLDSPWKALSFSESCGYHYHGWIVITRFHCPFLWSAGISESSLRILYVPNINIIQCHSTLLPASMSVLLFLCFPNPKVRSLTSAFILALSLSWNLKKKKKRKTAMSFAPYLPPQWTDWIAVIYHLNYT